MACACTALTFLPAPARAEIGPELAAKVAVAAPDAQIPVLVTLRRQVDAQDFEGRPQALLAALRRAAAATQPDVVDIVDDQPVKRFWLINAIAVRATPAEIAELDADPGVERVDSRALSSPRVLITLPHDLEILVLRSSRHATCLHPPPPSAPHHAGLEGKIYKWRNDLSQSKILHGAIRRLESERGISLDCAHSPYSASSEGMP